MKLFKVILFLSGIVLAGCSQAQRDDRQAGLYAEQLERGEAVSAQDYADMVSFYCDALDHTLEEIEPAAKAHAAALNANDSLRITTTATDLNQATAKAHEKRKNLVRLGKNLQYHMANIPDSTRNRLTDHILKITLRYSNYE